MPERESIEGAFAVTNIDQLLSEYSWRPKTELLHGGREAMLKKIQDVINLEGGLTEGKLTELGIHKNNPEQS